GAADEPIAKSRGRCPDEAPSARLGQSRWRMITAASMVVMVASAVLLAFTTRSGGESTKSREPAESRRPATPPAEDRLKPTAAPASHERPHPPPPASVWVLVEAHRDATLEWSIDDGPVERRRFEAGETRRLMASHKIMLATKDAGAFAVTVNGEP